MLEKLTSLPSIVLLALLLAIALLIWVDPYTKEGNAALTLTGFIFFTLLLRLLVGGLRLLFGSSRP